MLALFATVLFGSTGLTLTLFLVASVPLAGIAAYFASRPLVESRLLRAWASVAYAFLPAATGALAAGRLGTALLAILLPLMARAAVAAAGLQLSAGAVERGARPGWRATWALALMLTFTTAFTPVTWPIALVLAAATIGWRLVAGQRQLLVPHLLRFAALIITPIVLLAPWSLTLLGHPGRLMNEAGLPYGTGSASGADLLLLSPGGPKAGGGFLLIGVVLAALAALMRGSRRTAIVAAWAAATAGLLFAVVENGKDWAGPATLVYGLALLAAAAVGAEGANERIAASGFGWRQPVAGLIAIAAVAAPLLAAFTWVADGADGPIKRTDPVQVPAFVAEESTSGDQPRTLVINGTPARVSYFLVRGSGARLGDAELAAQAGRDSALDGVVANLVAGSGADQGSRLAGYAIRYVLAEKGAPRSYEKVLDSTPGLSRVSQTAGSELWRVDSDVSRITITGKGAQPVQVAAGRVEAHTKVPAGPSGRVLRLADSANSGWHATLDGTALTPTTVDGWAQGFELPATAGRLDVTFEEPVTHIGWLVVQAFLLLLVIVLALPGRRREVDDDLPEAEGAAGTTGAPAAAFTADIPAQAVGEGRRARRLQAAAEAEGAAAPDAPETGAGSDAGEPAEQTGHERDPYEQDPYEQPVAYDPAEGATTPTRSRPAARTATATRSRATRTSSTPRVPPAPTSSSGTPASTRPSRPRPPVPAGTSSSRARTATNTATCRPSPATTPTAHPPPTTRPRTAARRRGTARARATASSRDTARTRATPTRPRTPTPGRTTQRATRATTGATTSEPEHLLPGRRGRRTRRPDRRGRPEQRRWRQRRHPRRRRRRPAAGAANQPAVPGTVLLGAGQHAVHVLHPQRIGDRGGDGSRRR